ncbi:MAG: sigma-70 family RNA polymerase sigma factor [Ardenticatenaceae bacterium]|nr:sigma-70 family RNA polymerase sigma factor [Ardenticatenaceae bacterium]
MNDEQMLVQRAQQDLREFASLYDRYAERIYAYAQRELGDIALAQDVVSATFEKALKNLPRYRWRGTSFGAWLYKIARNEIMMHHRRQKWTAPLLDRFLSPHNVEQQVQQRQQLDELDVALAQLSRSDQELLRLRYHEALSHAEIGEVLNKSPRTVRVALHRALKRLRKQLAKQVSQEVMADVPLP